ncbi:MAG: hypothetical protein HYT34_00730 [Candidatus Ryanbacteria bacterium]|nr:hypothetical protein [Candidatus Ryanbacteria bacterium]
MAGVFQADLTNIAYAIRQAPSEIPKYVITDEVEKIDVTGSPMTLEPILFITDTYLPNPTGSKNVFYITSKEIPTMMCSSSCMVFPLTNLQQTAKQVEEKFPRLTLQKKDKVLLLMPKE